MAKVALVDNDETVRLRMGDEIHRRLTGVDVKHYSTGDMFLGDYPTEGPFDVVFLDHSIPGKSARDVLEEMKNSGYPTEIVCLLGSYSAYEDKRELRERFRIGYISKPFKMDEIITFCKKRGL